MRARASYLVTGLTIASLTCLLLPIQLASANPDGDAIPPLVSSTSSGSTPSSPGLGEVPTPTSPTSTTTGDGVVTSSVARPANRAPELQEDSLPIETEPGPTSSSTSATASPTGSSLAVPAPQTVPVAPAAAPTQSSPNPTAGPGQHLPGPSSSHGLPMASTTPSSHQTVTVPGSHSQAFSYLNETGEDIRVIVADGGHANEILYRPGELALIQCPPIFVVCTIQVSRVSDPLNAIINWGAYPNSLPTDVDDYVTETAAFGRGLSIGFTRISDEVIAYRNDTAEPVSILFSVGNDMPQSFVVQKGQSVTFPHCPVESGPSCSYVVGTGTFHLDPEKNTFVVSSIDQLRQDGPSFTETTNRSGPFIAEAGGIRYTNVSDSVTEVVFQDVITGTRSTARIEPGQSAILPLCTMSAGNRCSYSVGPPVTLSTDWASRSPTA